jgi:hypothetical protein
MMGCLIAQLKSTYKINLPNYIYKIGLYIGLVIITISLLKLQTNFFSPTIERLVITTATSICIFSVAFIDNMVLSNLALNYIGKISYSMYLVHQPLIAFYCKVYGIDISIKEKVCLVLATLFLASVSYEGIEQPFRNKTDSIKYRKIMLVAAFILLIGFSCYYDLYERNVLLNDASQILNKIYNKYFKNYLPTKINTNILNKTSGIVFNKTLNNIKSINNTNFETCNFNFVKKSRSPSFPFEYEDCIAREKIVQNTKEIRIINCISGTCHHTGINPFIKSKIVLLGDSSGLHYSLPFTLALREANTTGIAITKTCGFVDNTLQPGPYPNKCIGSRKMVIKELLNQVCDNSTIILMYNHIAYFVRSPYKYDFITDTTKGIRDLLGMGFRVVLVYPYTIPPNYNIDITKHIFAKSNSELYNTTTPYSEYFTREGAMPLINAFDSLGKVSHLLRVYPNKVFCGYPFSDRCNVMDCDSAYISDSDHYTLTGATLLINEIMNEITDNLTH